jgi:hypothetical protein
MASTTKAGKQREDRARTIRIRNADWDHLDTIAKRLGITRHRFIVKTIKKALVEATMPPSDQAVVANLSL